jgi:hypothetical protein
VLLYELLAGSPPFNREELEKAGMLEMLRVIREQEPSKPSTKLSTADGLPTLAAQRGTEPTKLTRLVRGELDWIVMKALEKDRGRRYETANGFAMDLQRYLADEAVLACPPSAAYRLRKFLRRNRGSVLAAGLILTVLVTGIVGTTIGLTQAQAAEAEARESAATAQREQQNAERELERAIKAERQAKEAEEDTRAYSRFLVEDVLETARPAGVRGGLGRDVTVRQAIDAAVLKLPETFKDRPRAEAIARHDLGVTYRLLGALQEAEPHLQRAVELRRSWFGAAHPDTLNSMNSLAVLFDDQGRFNEALRLYAEILPLKKNSLGPNHPDTLSTMNNLAQAYRHTGRGSEAVTLHEQTLALRKTTLGPEHLETLVSMHSLAAAYIDARRLPEAIVLLEETLRLRRAKLGANHPDTLRTLSSLATSYERSGRPEKAIPLQEEALRGETALLGPNHPSTLTSMHQLAGAYLKGGKQKEALVLFEDVLKRRRAHLGLEHPDTLMAMNNLAVAYTGASRLKEAIALFEEVLPLRKAKLGATHPHTFNIINNLAVIYDMDQQPAKAEPLYRELATALREKGQAGAAGLAYTQARLGRNLLLQQRPVEAEEVIRDSLQFREKKLPDHWATFYTRHLLGGSLSAQKKFAEAEPLLLQGYEGMKQRQDKISKDDAPYLIEALERLVQFYDAWGKPDQTAEWRKKLDEHKKDPGLRNPEPDKKPMPN